MKSLRLLLVLLSPMLLFLGCSKEKSYEVGTGSSASQWEFTEGSHNFHGKVDTAYKSQIAAGVSALMVQGTSDDGTGQITLGILGLTTTGAGVYKTPNVLFDYTKGTGTLYQNDLTATDQFTIEITKMDSASVTGVFSGKVKDSAGAIKTITNGKFSARLKTTAPPAGTGQITVWAKTGCGTGGTGPIKVELISSIATITSNITAFTATEPACGAAGTAIFNVPAGTYTYRATCGTDTVNRVITVASGQCIKSEVVFGATTQTGLATFWAKASCTAGGNITIKLSNTQTGTITSFTPAAPTNCTVAGNANFNLPVGTYTWVAKCGAADSIAGSLTVVASQCAKVEVAFPTGSPAQYSLVSSGGNCSNIQVHGTYYATKPLFPDTNNVVVQVNVTAIGSYSIGTNTVNGYSFSAAGNFTTVGVQNVTLKGIGTPLATGTNSFLVTAGSSTCSFTITVLPLPAVSTNSWSFTDATASKNFSGPFDIAFFGDDPFVTVPGKMLYLSGSMTGSDTTMDLYIPFPLSATQPVPGTYVTSPSTVEGADWYLYNLTTFDGYYYVKDPSVISPPADLKLTIIISSYDPVTKVVKGTFSGKAWNLAGSVVNITNGKFDAEVQF